MFLSLSGHSGCGLPSTSGTMITPFHAHRIRHAIVSANVHGQSCQMHLISPAWQTTLHDSCRVHLQCHAGHAVELFMYCQAPYMLMGILHAAHSKWNDQANDELRLSPILYRRMLCLTLVCSSLTGHCRECRISEADLLLLFSKWSERGLA